MKLIQNWKQVTLDTFVELHRLKAEQFDSVIERYIEVLFLLSDEEIETIEDMETVEIIRQVKRMTFLRDSPGTKFQSKIDKFTLVDFIKLKWGEFIDCEYYMEKGEFINVPTIAGILYKQSDIDEWGNTIYEPYKYDPVKRGELFLSLPVETVYGAVMEYYKFRNDLINNKYKHLFETEETEQEERGPLTSEERKAIERERRIKKRSYQKLTLDLAGGDMNKMRDIFELPLLFVLNMLAMQYELSD